MSPITLDDKALRGLRDIIRQEVQAAMGAASQQQPSAAAGERNTSTSAKSTSKGASRSQNPTQSQGATGSKARSQSPARQSTTGAGSKTVREDPKDKEIRELKDMIKELTATIKELRASIRHPKKTSDNEDAAEPTQLAQRPRTYADAAAKGKSSSVQKSQESSQSSAYTVVKTRSAVKVLGKPKDVGMPVQPTHGVAAEEARTWQASALLPLQLWKEAENKQLGLPVLNPNKPPAEWKVSERPGTFQRVLMLGGTADSCAELADMAFTSHPQVEHMAAIVNVPNTAGVKKATVADALRRMRLTRADLDVQGCLLTRATRITRAEWVHSEGPPRPIADQQLWMQWERTTMEQDDESDHQESDTAEHAPVVPSERESGFHKISLQIDPLMCSDSELPPNRTKGSAQRWVRQQTMEYLKTCMQEMTQAPPMAIFRRAEHYSVTMELPLEAAKRMLIGSGKLQGIEARPWMSKGSPGPGLEARILWLKAPNMKSSSNIWEILHSQYWFAGVLTGDTVGRWGVRIWGTEEPSEQQRTGIANLLGAEAPTKRTRIRVYGYPAGFGYGTTWAQEEAARVFPSGRVQVLSCQHLVNTSITKPVFDITVTGVPTEWQAHKLESTDTRANPRIWRRCVSHKLRPAAERVGRQERLRLATRADDDPKTTSLQDVVEDNHDMELGQ